MQRMRGQRWAWLVKPSAGPLPWLWIALGSAALTILVVAARPNSGLGVGRAVGWAPAAAFLCVQLSILGVMRWRAATSPGETDLWRWMHRGQLSGLVWAVGRPVLDHLPSARGHLPLFSMLVVCLGFCLRYRGLSVWNRVATRFSNPHDVLNGATAVLALVAIGNLVVARRAGAPGSGHWWQVEIALVQAATMAALAGTTLTVSMIAGMRRDPRPWILTAAFTASLVVDVVRLSSSGASSSSMMLAGLTGTTLVAAAALLPARPVPPHPADPAAATVGAFVVLLAAVTVLVLSPNQVTSASAWCAASSALGAGVALVLNVRNLALLASTRTEALTDELTGQANRRAVLRHLAAATAHDVQFALVVIDLDRFKEVNDALGHAAGDELLRMVTGRLEPLVTSADLVGRLGGDEFAVVLHDTAAPTAVAKAEAMASALREPFTLEGMAVHVAASLGVASSDEHGGDPSRLLQAADVAMYVAKRGGGGVSLYDAVAHAESQGQLLLVEELHTALATGQLVLHYQPKLAVASGLLVGAEALVRWQHPQHGLLFPDAFIDLAEHHGLMEALTQEVLNQAVAQAARWAAQGQPVRMSVNLSASNLLDTSLAARVADLLHAHQLSPSALVLEVTESELMTNPERSLAVIESLADLGATVSIDDYGTGYSSLAYLRRFPVGELKLDRSFTIELVGDERVAAIVASTIDLAHALGLRLVAEGVEDAATLHRLAELGCDETQGYLHSKPLPAAAFDRWRAGALPSVLERDSAPEGEPAAAR